MNDLSFNELYEEYNKETSDKQNIRKIIDEKIISSSEKIKKHYESLPDYNDDNFIKEISEKAEFFYHKNNFDIKNLNEKCFSQNFKLENHQKFLKNFMNYKTPYKSLLVFHGVGVGKTCTAVTISRCFKDLYKDENKKIICLVSKNIKPEWKKTIYDPEKGENQCSGNEFTNFLSNDRFHAETGIKRKVNQMIKKYYEFYGYQEFSNRINKLVRIRLGGRSEALRETVTKDVIEEMFSDRLLIIDEIHNIRSDNTKFSSDTIKNIKKVIKYSKNLRLIGLSATPMFNQSTEIIELLNMFLMNDNRPTIQEKDIFTKDGNLKEDGEELLIKKSRGYISYLRGENPYTFPIRLYPEFNNDKLVYKPEIKKNIHGNDTFYKFIFLQLYLNKFTGIQRLSYSQFIKNLNKSNDLQLDERTIGLQLSNITYPYVSMKPPGNIKWKEMYGERGLMNTFNPPIRKNKKMVYSYKKEILEKYGPIFQLDKIKTFSIKIYNILKGLCDSNSEGIIFIYSDYIKSGILPLAFALEELGIVNVSGNILNTDHKINPIDYRFREKKDVKDEFFPAKYSLISGDKNISPNNEKEIKEIKKESNKDGKNIKIIIGNKVIAEGIDLKNIREIHILDPWYHLNKIEQIIGRGIRYCSHKMLEPEKRNVTIYLHTGNEKNEKESIDSNTYKLAEDKAINISHVEKILKENAIDCFLNKSVNLIHKNDVHPRKMISSRTKEAKNFYIYDKPYSKLCSFSEICEYKCNNDDINENNLNFDTFFINEPLQYIKEIIIELFELHYYYTIDEIKTYIHETINTYDIFIYEALQEIIDERTPIWYGNDCGYIVYKNKYYLFQPYSNNDESIPLYYRINNIYETKKHSILIEDSLFEYEMINIQFEYQDIINLFINEEKFILNEEILYGKTMISYKDFSKKLLGITNDNIYIEFIVDQLYFDQKKILLMEICFKKKLNKLEQTIYNYFNNNFIYKNNEIHINKSNDEIIGFFLNNNDNYEYFIYKDGEWKTGKDILIDIKQIKEYKNTFLIENQELILTRKKPTICGYSWWNTRINSPSFKYIPSLSTNPGKELKNYSENKDDFNELINNIDYDEKMEPYIIKYSKLFRFIFEIVIRFKNKQFYNYDTYLLFKI